MNLQMLKKAMLAYVSAVKFIWSGIAYPLSIVGKKFMNLRGYRVYGNSVQDGTPSPDNPIEIESVGDLSTKNLFDVDNALVFNGYIDGLNKIANYNPTPSYFATLCINCKPNTTYTVSRKLLSARFTAASSSNSPAANIEMSTSKNNITGLSITITTGESDEYLYVWFYNRNVDTNYTYQEIMEGIQIEEGTTATDYEPYHKYKIPVVARGRNLLPAFTFKTFTSNGVTFTNNNDGSITLNGTPTGYAVTPIMSLPYSSLEVLRNNACVLTGFYKCLGSNVTLGIDVFLDSTLVKQYYISTSTSANYIKVDLRSLNFNKINLNVKRSNNDKLIDNVTVKPFLEVGTTMPTSFEPYIEPVITNIFLDKPLRRTQKGVYTTAFHSDYIDFKNKKIIRNVAMKNKLTGTPKQYDKTMVLTGATASPLGNAGSSYYYRFSVMCSHLQKGKEVGDGISSDISFSNATGRDIGISLAACGIDYTSETALDEFNALIAEWNASGKFQMMYPVATPIEEDVNLPMLPQFKGTTIYEIQTDIKPSGMEAKYC